MTTFHGNIRKDLLDRVEESLPDSRQAVVSDGKTETYPLPAQDPHQRNGPIKSLAEFYELFERVLREAEREEGKQYHISFMEEFPPDFALLPCFTAELVSRNLWTDNKGRAELLPRYRETVQDPDNPGNLIKIYAQQFINEVEIVVWAKGNKVANELADWIEAKFYQYIWIFQKSGIGQPVLFQSRGRDIKGEVNGQVIHGRPLRFSVITIRITERNETAMRQIALNLGLQYAGRDSI